MIKILKMLEDPESDNDELNARIWCFEQGAKFVRYRKKTLVYKDHPSMAGTVTASNIPYYKYTTSLDAAMSIGAEELEGWQITIRHSVPISGFQCVLISRMGPDAQRIESPWSSRNSDGKLNCKQGLIMTRAICHARIQALEYVRGL